MLFGNKKQKNKPSEKDISESNRVLAKYMDRVPVIVFAAQAKKGHEINLSKEINKFLVPNDLTIGQFIFILRKSHIKELKPAEGLFLFCDGISYKTSCTMEEIFHEQVTLKNKECKFLYFEVSKENTFGAIPFI